MSDGVPVAVDRLGGGTLNGDGEGAGSIYQGSEVEYWRDTYLHAYSLVGNRADAEDLAQEAYLRLFQRGRASPKIDSYVNWMRAVVRNAMCLRFTKTRPDLHGPTAEEDDDDPVSKIIDPSESIEQKLIHENLVRQALRILARLPAMERECVMMYARGYTFVQIARALEMPYAEVIKKTTRAVTKIRSKIEEFPPTRQVGSERR